MNNTEKELSVGFKRNNMSMIKGERTRRLVNFVPSTAEPGNMLEIDIPKLKKSYCIVPGSIHLVFDFIVSGSKSWFLNNLSSQLLRRLKVTLAGEVVYECDYEGLYKTYKDLWLSKTDREKMVEYGVAGDNLRKLISVDDSSAKSGDASKVSDALLLGIYGTK